MVNRYFTADSLSFLSKLARNNNRDWFEKHKADYETMIRTPALQFITDMADDLPLISPHFLAVPKKMGGSLMRVYRDVRFGKDKRPYKTNIGIQFRHEQGKDVHAPGFYVHIELNDCFVGVGIWRPDAPTLGKIRDAIVEQPAKWKNAISSKSFSKQYVPSGESLTRPPKGYAKDHPLIEDIKRKDFIAIATLDDNEVLSPRFKKQVLDRFRAADKYMHFLCNALTLRY
jgi:uncharacterized protein (TIGR02453 family)